MTLEILGYIAAAVTLFIGGIATHGWLTRQKSPTLTLDAIKAATALIAEAQKSADDAVLIATERQQAVALALSQAAARLPAASPAKSA